MKQILIDMINRLRRRASWDLHPRSSMTPTSDETPALQGLNNSGCDESSSEDGDANHVARFEDTITVNGGGRTGADRSIERTLDDVIIAQTGVDFNENKRNVANPLICSECAAKLCPSCAEVLAVLAKRNEECSELYNVTPFQLALRRMPALVLTMALELLGGLVISVLSDALVSFVLLSSFMPCISALSGNLGLQTSSNITRGLSTGNVPRGTFGATIRKEVLSGLFCAVTIAVLLGITGCIWSSLSAKTAEVNLRDVIHLYPLIFGGVVGLGTLLSMMISSTNGTLTPMIAFRLGLDPAKVAGPLETAFQDIAGQSFLLGFASIILLPLLKTSSTTTATTMATTTITTTVTMAEMMANATVTS